MVNLRSAATRIASGVLLSVVLFGCDRTTPLAVSEAPVSQVALQAEKLAALHGDGDMGTAIGRQPVMPLSYGVESIPFVQGPTGLANLGPVCDDCVMNNVPIFPFTFYGNTYTSLQISSNGFVRFDKENDFSGCCSGRPIPLNDFWNNIIAFAWTDLNPSGALGGRLRWETLGAPGARRFVLHADEVRYFGSAETNLIQWLILYEGTSCIEIHTQMMTPRVITQGIENANGTEAHFIPGRVATTFSLTNDGLRFCPAPVVPPCHPVTTISDVYSGLPRQPPGVINLLDEWVFVEILNLPPYGPFVPPVPSVIDRIRIGADYNNGTPAADVEVFAGINGRIRFSLADLVNDGNLDENTEEIHIWIQDVSLVHPLLCGTHAVTVHPPGRIVAHNDEHPLSDFAFSVPGTQAGQFALNVASFFTGGQAGQFLFYSNNFGLTGTSLRNALQSAGHTVVYSTSPPDFILPNLLTYDGVWVCGSAPGLDTGVLTEYVNAGGNVYVCGGTANFGGAVGEAAFWNAFLNNFNLSFAPVYNNITGVVPIASSHQVLVGVTGLYQDLGQSISKPNPNPPSVIIATHNGQGMIAVYPQ
jgi:hypothetical protein